MNWKINLKEWLRNNSSGDFEFLESTDLSMASTLKLKSRGDLLKVYTEDFVSEMFEKFDGRKFKLLGKGANTVLPEANDDFIYLKTSFKHSEGELSESRDSYYLSASTSLSKVVSHAMSFGKKKWNVLTGIPGTLGGAVAMNAGTKLGEISGILSSVRIVRANGEIEEFKVSADDFSYRKNHFLKPGDLLSYIRLNSFGDSHKTSDEMREYLEYRKRTQPLWEKTCGSVFKNDLRYLAGKSIDVAGMKGVRCNGLGVSELHANFIINHDEGNQSDFIKLTTALKKELELTYGVLFELEASFL